MTNAGAVSASALAGDQASAQLIRGAAIGVFVEHGYHGTSVREIAQAAGISVAGLYHHFPSKLDILIGLMDVVMDDLFRATSEAVARAGEDPADQLRAAVIAHVRFHTERREESFIGNTELRSLDRPHRARMIEKRDRQQRLFDRAVIRGRDLDVFRTAYPLEASRAIVTMSTTVATWYRKDGSLRPQDIAARYGELALATVQFQPSSGRLLEAVGGEREGTAGTQASTRGKGAGPR
jgi:AcrR family transcriptional regulator